MSRYVIAAVGDWNREIFTSFINEMPGEWRYVDAPEQLSYAWLKDWQPDYIFFPHWRWKVASDIVAKFECVCFHMTDLPYGRGGSPLQNLILAGQQHTQLTALKMTDELDAGPIYAKVPLALDGSAHAIYQASSRQVITLIQRIISQQLTAQPQQGEAHYFQRRTPAQSQLPNDLNAEQLYDFIRMLDAPGYPHAYVDIAGWRLSLTQAERGDDSIEARVVFTKIKDESDDA
ncbi:methionyl-tRNA formyltransferase [Shewanella sp. NIFS-20-20]|uniref:methionyl-tRNA formyltransferase n=1 Tax=Shewanella sp. NIFS-20-20 TaxID=2853806 RepID=UPI001C450FE5|nr:methionyl-tRNA formyltransferase [Shewanella sp. NIFS-20-20]MBV7316391.1 methionyl-tRNA formyltransferase [Shewanella sp. NIFS-20-20]